MKRIFSLLLLALLLGGCISQERTPYHEIALTGETSQDTTFLWPFYMGDKRAHYALWPLIKKSPGCFALLPFYNYDHGIHDIALIATRSTHTNESRLFPLWYQNPNGWLLFPFAYSFWDETHANFGSPLLFNVIREGSDFEAIHALLYFSNRSSNSSRKALFPFFSYYARQDKEDYALWTPLFRRGVKTWSYQDEGKLCTERHFYNRNSLLSLYGFTHDQSWTGTKETPRQTLTTDKTFSWIFPFWWQWGDHLTGERGDLLLPLYFRKVNQLDAPGTYATPLFGWGADRSWWYALNCGRYEDSRWVLPFAFWTYRNKDGVLERNLWTPLGYANTTRTPSGPTELHAWGIGPLLPIIANGDDDTFNLLGSFLWYWKHYPLQNDFRANLPKCVHCRPRNTGTMFECTRSNLLLGTLYAHYWEREYEAESLVEQRPIYIEQNKTHLGLLLWSQDQCTLHGSEHLPKGATYPGKTGASYSLLGGLWSTEAWLTLSVHDLPTDYPECKEHHWSSHDYLKFKNSTHQTENTYGWILWQDEATIHTDCHRNQLVETAFRTPLFGWGTSHYQTATGETHPAGNKYSILLALYRHEASTYHFNDERCYTPHGATDRRDLQEQSILAGLLWKQSQDTFAKKHTTARDLDPTTPDFETEHRYDNSLLCGLLAKTKHREYSNEPHGGSYTKRFDRDFLCSLLYHEEMYCHQNQYCDNEVCRETLTESGKIKCWHVTEKTATKTHDIRVLLGLLANYSLDDTLRYERTLEAPDAPETCISNRFKERFTVLLGIPYASERSRDGTVKRKGLLGLLFDQRHSPTDNTETFGILGFLYRSNRHADGTRERLIFPFIRTTSHETNDTASFSFFGNFLKYERLPDGSTDWTLFWL